MRSLRNSAALLLLLTLSACAGGPAASHIANPVLTSGPVVASPTGTSVEPSATTPSPAGSGSSASPSAGSPGKIAIDSIALVVTDDLRVRSKPGVSNDSLLLAPLLGKGREAFVVAGPVTASGFAWYEVQPIRRPGQFDDLPLGWVAAAAKDGEPWLASRPPDCPAAPDTYTSVVALRPLIGVSCFGADELTFAARVTRPEATCGVELGWTIEPEWLGSTCQHPAFIVLDPQGNDSFDAVLDPTTDIAGLDPGVELADAIDVLVSGHFDDAAAGSCQGASTEAPIELTPEEIVLRCRTQFVITKLEPDGYLP